MSVPVPIEALATQVRSHGAVAFLITTSEEGGPHTVSVAVVLDGSTLRAAVGRTTASNAAARPSVTLLWPPSADPRYCLVVDAEARVEGTAGVDATVVLTPTRAVQHRQADAPADSPSCLPVQ